jgi:hypothetical protein
MYEKFPFKSRSGTAKTNLAPNFKNQSAVLPNTVLMWLDLVFAEVEAAALAGLDGEVEVDVLLVTWLTRRKMKTRS